MLNQDTSFPSEKRLKQKSCLVLCLYKALKSLLWGIVIFRNNFRDELGNRQGKTYKQPVFLSSVAQVSKGNRIFCRHSLPSAAQARQAQVWAPICVGAGEQLKYAHTK